SRPIDMLELGLLDFDVQNPRFGAAVGQRNEPKDVLNHLVGTFGVEDVLSSIAVNGYFLAEPMICRKDNGRFTVVEGNRRLAACLILAGDARAIDQKKYTEQFQALRDQHKKPKFDRVPCIVFESHESERDLLAYLGVRHIASSQGWDSFAKAAWIARAVEQHNISLIDISAMTGDQNKTVSHLLEGYYFVQQMVDSGYFIPSQSTRKGRGSNPAFPFSWIYTLFFSPSARKFVGLPAEPTPNPVPVDKLPQAGRLLERMFGATGKSAAIDDSRDITRLARILDDTNKVALLETGRHIDEIEFESQPLEDKLRQGLQLCHDKLGVLLAAMEAAPPDRSQAMQSESAALAVAHLSRSIWQKLNDATKASALGNLPPQV
ncbi:MAG: hypothetical protein PHH58_14460, partial [Rhodoferax sp.]|nr:hypothetical protein [Rhodoferax sp.]